MSWFKLRMRLYENEKRTESSKISKKQVLQKNSLQKKFSNAYCFWRGVRDSNPRGPTGHRLSRPAPYQARATPHLFFRPRKFLVSGDAIFFFGR